MKKFKIRYRTCVKKSCGFRQEYVDAIAEQISEKRVRVIEADMSEAAASCSKRQQFDPTFWASIEVGKIKNISTLVKCEPFTV